MMSTDYIVHIIICATLLCLYLLVYAPLLIHAAYRFYSNSDKMIVSKRNPKLTLLNSIIALIAITIYGPTYLLFTSDFNSTLTTITDHIAFVMYPFLAYAFIWGLTMKYWLLSFEINWLKSTQNAKWKIHINQSQADHNWFLSHKQTLGRPIYVFKIVTVFCCISQATYFLIVFFFSISLTYYIIQIIILIIPITIIMIMWKMTPALYDHLYYRQESRIMIIFGAIYIITYFLLGISSLFGATPYIRQILLCIVGTTGYFFVSFFQLQFSVSKLNKSTENTLINSVVSSEKNTVTSEIPRTPTSDVKQEDIGEIMRNILNDGDRLSTFFDHLAHEFSIECGLAYIEFVQYKQLIDQDLFANKECIVEANEISVLCNVEIPQSFIVYSDINRIEYHARHTSGFQQDVPNFAINGGGTLTEFALPMDKVDSVDHEIYLHPYQMRAYLLYKKYVDPKSHLQINISHKQRCYLAQLLIDRQNRMNINAETLFSMWDSALHELWKLMTHSCYRFIKTSTYLALSNNIED